MIKTIVGTLNVNVKKRKIIIVLKTIYKHVEQVRKEGT